MELAKLMIFVPDLAEAKRFYGGVFSLDACAACVPGVRAVRGVHASAY